MNDRNGHGMWPYLLPMFSFLLVLEIGRRIPAGFEFSVLLVQVLLPLGLLIAFRFRGAYPELQFRIDNMTLVDVLLGIVLAALWMAPYILLPGTRPEMDGKSLDPAMLGAAWTPVVLSLRMVGYAIVTPWMEEILMRSFLIRYAYRFDVRDESADDFRDVPIGKFGWYSFAVVVAVFLATHETWEWWAMLPWAVLTNLWFYYRKNLFALIVVHAVTNASILLAAIVFEGRFSDGNGGPLSLWFFV